MSSYSITTDFALQSPFLQELEEPPTLELRLQTCFKLVSLHITAIRGQRFPCWYAGTWKRAEVKSLPFPWPDRLDIWGNQHSEFPLSAPTTTQGRNLEAFSILSFVLPPHPSPPGFTFLVLSPIYPLVCISTTAALGQCHQFSHRSWNSLYFCSSWHDNSSSTQQPGLFYNINQIMSCPCLNSSDVCSVFLGLKSKLSTSP